MRCCGALLLLSSLAYCAANDNLSLRGGGDRLLDGSKNFPWLNLATDTLPNLDIYHSTEELSTAVTNLQCDGMIQIENHNKLQVVTLTNPKSTKTKTKIFFIFGIHGREYIASEAGLRFLTNLCDGSEKSKALLDAAEFKVIPTVNPAGRTKVELGATCAEQRKNANNVDLNRNFDIMWDQGSGLTDEEDYHGPGPFSEPESQLIRDIATSWKPTVFVDVHSGARTMMLPYSYKAEPCPDHLKMAEVLQKVNTEVFSNNPVRSGASGATIGYTAAGTTIDFLYEKLGIPFTFTYEIFKGTQGLNSARDAVVLMSNSTRQRAALLELEGGLELAPVAADDRMIPSDPQTPQPEGSINLNLETLADCFAYFNPTSKDLVETTVAEWSQAMMTTAEFFTLSR